MLRLERAGFFDLMGTNALSQKRAVDRMRTYSVVGKGFRPQMRKASNEEKIAGFAEEKVRVLIFYSFSFQMVYYFYYPFLGVMTLFITDSLYNNKWGTKRR